MADKEQLITLDENTFAVFKALLAVGGATTVTDIARRTKLKRTTLYTYIEHLIEIGVVERILLNKRTLYRAHNPNVLFKYLDKQRDQVNSLIQMYESHKGENNPVSPHVHIFEGLANLEELYEEIIHANSVRAWFGFDSDANVYFYESFYTIAEAIRAKKINMRDIIADDTQARNWARKMSRLAGPTYKYKVAPTKDLDNDTIIYDNTVAIFRILDDNFFAVRIEDPTIAKTFRAIFDTLWKKLD